MSESEADRSDDRSGNRPVSGDQPASQKGSHGDKCRCHSAGLGSQRWRSGRGDDGIAAVRRFIAAKRPSKPPALRRHEADSGRDGEVGGR